MGALKLTACMKVVSKMGDMDQEALLERLDRYTADGVPKERAQVMAAADTLAELQDERKEFMAMLREQHPDIFRITSNIDEDASDPADLKFSKRRKPDPKKTVKAYKLFRVDERHPGKLFPLFVNANDPVLMNVWLDAEEGPAAAGGKVKSKLGPLAYRPGWHAGDLPIATHIGEKSSSSVKKPDLRPDNHVWAEVEMAADRDWQAEANKRGTNAAGKLVSVKAHITDQIPVDGYYRYKTNPNMTGNWLIGGSMKVNRILSDKEVERINKRAGVSDLPRKTPLDARRYGLDLKRSSARDVTDTPAFKKWFGNSAVVDADGKPLVVYHGTNRKFTEFSLEKSGDNFSAGKGAFFFTPDKAFADQMADHTVETTDDDEPGSQTVMSVYLSLKNPLVKHLDGRKVNVRLAIKEARTAGHDGVILYDAQDTMPAWAVTQYIAFNPTQIKSATGNNGRFDGNDPDISRSSQREFNPNLPRGTVLEPSKEELNLDRQIIEAEQEASALWSREMNKILDQIVVEMQPKVKGLNLDEKTAKSLARSLFYTRRESEDVESQPEFDEYRAAADKATELRKRRMQMVYDRIGPPEFDGMQQLKDFHRPITETKNFKRWFEGSKVVDKDGRPLIALHGTNKDFAQFRTMMPGEKQVSNNNWMGQLGSWFAAPSQHDGYEAGSAEATSDTFAELRGNGDDGVNEGAVVYPVFLSIKNPYETETYEDITEQRDEAGGGRAFREKLIADGYDGVVVRDSSTDGGQFRDDWIAFYPEQIKSALGNNGDFDPNNGDITKSTKRNNLGFYSALAKGIEDMPTKSALAGAWKAQIKGLVNKGVVKQDEVEWSGLEDWMDLQQGKIAKEQIADYLKANGVQVTETQIGKKIVYNLRKMSSRGKWYTEDTFNTYDEAEDAYNEARAEDDNVPLDITEEEAEDGSTKYGQYTLPGGENYREVLLTLPVKQRSDAFEKKALELYGKSFDRLNEAQQLEVEGELGVDEFAGSDGTTYKSSHWDEPNVLAHIRLNDRTDADGKRVLFVEELQSDWGQQGKKEGFFDKSKLKGFMFNPTTEEIVPADDAEAHIWEYDGKEVVMPGGGNRAQAEAAVRKQWYVMPTAPFVTKTEGWLNLALKRVIAMAADGGYDKVAFVNGEQSADRYSLEKQVKYIQWNPGYVATRKLITLETSDGKELGITVQDGIVEDSSIGADGKPLDEVLGKEVANKILNNASGDLRGIDLKMGGEGMKAFYDKIVPNAVSALLKRVGGGKLGEVSIDTEMRMGEYDIYQRPAGDFALRSRINRTDSWSPNGVYPTREAAEQRMAELKGTARQESLQPGFYVTDAMREKVSQGLPLFSRKRQEDTDNFKRWSEDLPVVEGGSNYEGGPAVFVAYHGTTHDDITEFKRVGATEGFLGKGPYFTTDPDDASANYAGVGPDLTQRISRESERIYDSFHEDEGYATDLLNEFFDEKKINEEITDENLDSLKDQYGEMAVDMAARKALKGKSDGLMMKTYVKLTNPADATGNQMLDYNRIENEDGEIEDETGAVVDWVLKAREIGEQYGISSGVEDHIDDVLSGAIDGDISMKEIFDSALERLGDAYDDNGELVSAGQIFSEIAEELGYDGVIMDAGDHFGPGRRGPMGITVKGMKGVKSDTLHIVPFDGKQVKSFTGNNGEFGDNRDITKSTKRQTETPEFKRWFGDSKVVDAKGKPLVVYHGSYSRDINEFKPGRAGGIYFSPRQDHATQYGPNVTAAYLKISKLGDLTDTGSAAYKLAVKSFNESGGWSGNEDVMAERSSPDFDPELDYTWEMFDWPEADVQSDLFAAGYDGFKLEEYGGDTSYVVFDSTQIKSATGNDGGFDPTNPDIRKSTGRTSTGADWDSPSASKFDDMVYKLQDKQIDLKRVVESVKEASGAIADDLNVYLQEELYHGRAAKRTEDFVNMELNPLMRKLSDDGLKLEDLEEFLHARHAKEANEVIARRNPGVQNLQDGGSGMMTADAQQYMATLPADLKQKLEAAAAKVDAIISKTRDLYVDYELESRDTVDAWGAVFKHYIPLQREEKSGSPGIGQGFSVKGRETKGRTGSTRKVVDIMANIALQREKAITRGEKNRVSQALVGLAQSNPNEDFWTVNEVPTERVFNEKTGLVEERIDPLYKSRDNAVIAKIMGVDGKVREHAVLFNEEDERALRMAKSLKNLDAANLEGLIGVSAKITRYFAAVNTQYNPVFGIVNLVRDVQGALLNLSSTELSGEQGKIAKYTMSALRGIYGDTRAARKGGNPSSAWAALWDEFQEVGGQTGYRDLFKTSADRAEALKNTLNPDAWADSRLGKIFTANGTLKVPMAQAKRSAGWIFDWLSDYNLAMENGVRLAAYKAGLEKGMSKEQAASAAKNLTVNFNRKGQVSQQAGAVYAFFNASLQGTARIAQTIFEMEPGKPKTIRLSPIGKKIVYGGMLLGSVQAMAMAAAGFGEDDPPDFARERSLIIPVGGKKYITIPMPLGFHVIPSIGRIATEFALSGFKNPHERALSLVSLFADTFNPIGNAGLSMQTLAPTALDPFVALTENKDYTGKPIARESSNKAIPGHSLGRDTATSLSKFLSEGINTLSGGNKYTAGVFSPTPDQIDYLIGQVTGGVGRELSKVEQTVLSTARGEDLPTYKIPLVGRFVGDAKSQASEGTAFYANTERLNRLETEIKGLQKDGKTAEASAMRRDNSEAYLITVANQAERQIQRLRNEKRELIKNDAPREQVKAVEERITGVMARLNRAVESLREKQPS